MYSYEFPVPYEEMMVYSVICIVCLVGAGWVIKHFWRGLICPHLIPLCLVILSYIVSSLYSGGIQTLFTFDWNDIKAVTNGLAAVGLYELVTQTTTHIRFKRMLKDNTHKTGKKVA